LPATTEAVDGQFAEMFGLEVAVSSSEGGSEIVGDEAATKERAFDQKRRNIADRDNLAGAIARAADDRAADNGA